MTTESRIKSINAQLSKLNRTVKRLETQRTALTQRSRLERAKKAGVVVGGYYKAIPTYISGNVVIGKCLKIQTENWNDNVLIGLVIPAQGKFPERTTFISLDSYEFQKVLKPGARK